MTRSKVELLKEPYVVWISDLHINSKMALRYPEMVMDDGDTSIASPRQMALWEAWLNCWETVKKRAKGRPVVVIFGGEIADKDAKNRSYQYITKNGADILKLAFLTIQPALEVGIKFIVLRGTEAHTGKSSNLDEIIATEMSAKHDVVRNVQTGTFSWYYFKGVIGGRIFDLAHHVNMGGLPWTERNAANALSARLTMTYAEAGEKLPDFAMRGHVHRVADSSINYHIRSLIAPAWSLDTSFLHRIGQGAKQLEIGAILVDPLSKEVDYLRYKPKSQDMVYL